MISNLEPTSLWNFCTLQKTCVKSCCILDSAQISERFPITCEPASFSNQVFNFLLVFSVSLLVNLLLTVEFSFNHFFFVSLLSPRKSLSSPRTPKTICSCRSLSYPSSCLCFARQLCLPSTCGAWFGGCGVSWRWRWSPELCLGSQTFWTACASFDPICRPRSYCSLSFMRLKEMWVRVAGDFSW